MKYLIQVRLYKLPIVMVLLAGAFISVLLHQQQSTHPITLTYLQEKAVLTNHSSSQQNATSPDFIPSDLGSPIKPS